MEHAEDNEEEVKAPREGTMDDIAYFTSRISSQAPLNHEETVSLFTDLKDNARIASLELARNRETQHVVAERVAKMVNNTKFRKCILMFPAKQADLMAQEGGVALQRMEEGNKHALPDLLEQYPLQFPPANPITVQTLSQSRHKNRKLWESHNEWIEARKKLGLANMRFVMSTSRRYLNKGLSRWMSCRKEHSVCTGPSICLT